MKLDRKKGLLLIESFSNLKKSVRFEGFVSLGVGCKVPKIYAREIVTAKGCVLGRIICDRIFLGAFSTFNSIEAVEAIISNSCEGERIVAKAVRIGCNCDISEIKAELLEMKGISKIQKMEALKIRCLDFI